MSSDASRQTFTFFRGRTIEAVATTAAMPAIKVLNCSTVIFPCEARAEGTSRYSFNRARENTEGEFGTPFPHTPPRIPPKGKRRDENARVDNKATFSRRIASS